MANVINYSPVAKIREDRFFQRPPTIAFIFFPIMLSTISIIFLVPSSISTFGTLGSASIFITKYLPNVIKMTFYFMWALHILCAWLAVKLCRQKGIHPETTRNWCIQTLVCGLVPLFYIVEYQPDMDKKVQ